MIDVVDVIMDTLLYYIRWGIDNDKIFDNWKDDFEQDLRGIIQDVETDAIANYVPEPPDDDYRDQFFFMSMRNPCYGCIYNDVNPRNKADYARKTAICNECLMYHDEYPNFKSNGRMSRNQNMFVPRHIYLII